MRLGTASPLSPDVGGNAEFPSDVAKAIRYLNFSSDTSTIVEAVSWPPSPHRFEAVVQDLNDDYLNRISAIVHCPYYHLAGTNPNLPERHRHPATQSSSEVAIDEAAEVALPTHAFVARQAAQPVCRGVGRRRPF
jgi:hypothetical protein